VCSIEAAALHAALRGRPALDGLGSELVPGKVLDSHGLTADLASYPDTASVSPAPSEDIPTAVQAVAITHATLVRRLRSVPFGLAEGCIDTGPLALQSRAACERRQGAGRTTMVRWLSADGA
jgi:hypothetical protein